ncbi:magnesium transporter MRS2-F-like [Asparagus officinalis]|uniref:magnesium transporter MRS2-F-like n=1 Tax=Asparagus officinalis TaxID=4686 RepID=UPI00098E0E79|nr:magnesium transporter MRS2-F-like [Asparagus officinalis]
MRKTVRDELEHLLDHDMDMAEMYLSEKLMSNRVGEMSSRGDLDNDGSEMDEERDEDFKNETENSHGSYIGFKPSIEDLEMLLEAYFV